MIYGYARVSTYAQSLGTSLEEQEHELREHGAETVVKEAYTGTQINRPLFDALISGLKKGDTLIVTKMDRFARTAPEACALVRSLVSKGVIVNILNMGVADNTTMGKLMLTILAGFAEFERDLIVERTQTGKAIAKQREGYREGRPKKYCKAQIDHALELLSAYSYRQVEEMTGISISTLVCAKRNNKNI